MQFIFLDVQQLPQYLKIIILVAGILALLAVWGTVLYFIRRWVKQRTNAFLLKAQLETQEQTFKNMSANIHDNIGQTLTVVKLQLDGIKEKDESISSVILPSLTKVMDELRDLAHSLSADRVKESGLEEAIRFDITQSTKTNMPAMQLKLSEDSITLNDDAEILLYRIYQEALQNSLKHAEATDIVIGLNVSGDSFTLSVADNGKGMIPGKQGQGLKSIQERAKLLGGKAFFHTGEHGTEVAVKIPVRINLRKGKKPM